MRALKLSSVTEGDTNALVNFPLMKIQTIVEIREWNKIPGQNSDLEDLDLKSKAFRYADCIA